MCFQTEGDFFEIWLILNNLELLILWWRTLGKKNKDVTATEDSSGLTGKRECYGTLNVSLNAEIRKGEKHQTLRFIKVLFLSC